MSRVAARGDEATGAGKGALAAVFVVATALVLLLIVRARPGPEPFDPRSGAADGTNALVEVLTRAGADVAITRTPPEPGTSTRLLILVDRLNNEQRSATLDYLDAGGVAVVADPTSSLHGGSDLDDTVTVSGDELATTRAPVVFEANVRPGVCNIGALSALRGLYVPDGVLFPVQDDDRRCFGDGGQSFVIVHQVGDGTVVGFGDNEILTNRHLRRADNAGLATALLVPEQNTEIVILLGTAATAANVSDVGSGEDTLFDLVPRWVWMTVLLGVIAFVAFAISRSVRIGKVLDEPLATPIAGSELVAATGNLMQRAKHASRAGSLLQAQLQRDLSHQHHIDVHAPLDDLDRAVSARTGTQPGAVEAVLGEQVSDDAQLLALSARIEHIRKESLT